MPIYGRMFKPGEVILVYIQDEPAFFARIEDIQPDRKKGWWQLSFLILTIPLRKMTWILDNDQMRGAGFTMGGTPVRIERVKAPEEEEKQENSSASAEAKGGARIVSMFDEDQE